MDLKYWDKREKKYISKEEAMEKGMHGIRRHEYITKEDLINGGGLPDASYAFNCDFVIVVKKQAYKIINPMDNPATNTLTLETNWAGEVVMVESSKGVGLLDLKSGEMLIPYGKNHYGIYPLNKDYFCIVDPTLENKKIVNRQQTVLDSIHGTYVRNGNQLMRHIIKDNGKYATDGRLSIKSLERREKTLTDRKNLEQTIINLKQSGMTIEELTKLVNKIYNKNSNMNM